MQFNEKPTLLALALALASLLRQRTQSAETLCLATCGLICGGNGGPRLSPGLTMFHHTRKM